MWSGIEKETKNPYREDSVPIIPQLNRIVNAYGKSVGSPTEGWVWPASRGTLPLDFNNLCRRGIMQPLNEAGLTWHGWHAFRRGLASNLSELVVPEDVIQKILRHGDLSTTQRFYRKTRRPAVTEAMNRLSKKVGKRQKMSDSLF